MKLKYIIFAIAATFALIGCKQEFESGEMAPRIQLGSTAVKLTGIGGQKAVTISSNCDWYAEASESWVHVAPPFGTASTTSINIMVDENDNKVDRSAFVTVRGTTGALVAELQVSQTADMMPAGSMISDADSFMDFLDAAPSATESDDFYVLEDVDLGGAEITPINIFAGKLHGDGHKIYNFKLVSKTPQAGIIMENRGLVEDIVFGSKDGKTWDNTSVITFASSVESAVSAALIATTAGDLTKVINFAKVKFNVATAAEGNPAAAGIAGQLIGRCTISGCENHGEVEFSAPFTKGSKPVLGGIVGYNAVEGSEVKGCSNFGELSRSANVNVEFSMGGIVARTNVKMLVEDCVNEGAVTYSSSDAAGSYIHLAGIVGGSWNGSTIRNCNNNAPISSTLLQVNRMGGVVGTLNNNGVVEACTNKGEVRLTHSAANTNWQSIGGIVGFQEKGSSNIIRGCVNDGKVIMEVEDVCSHANNRVDAGGIVGLAVLAVVLEDNVNNGEVTMINRAAGESHAGGIASWIRGGSSRGNVNNGKVSCTSAGNVGAIAGGVVGVVNAGITCTEDINNGEVNCGNLAGSLAGSNAGTIEGSTAGGSVNGTLLDDSNFLSLVSGANTGSLKDIKSPSGSVTKIPELSLEKSEGRVEAEATSATFSVKSNCAWTVSCDAAWISDFTRSGENDGSVNISFAANTSTTDERTAVFTVSVENLNPVSYTLVQGKVLDSAPHCIPSAEELELFAAAAAADTPDFSRWSDENGMIRITADIDASALNCFPIALVPEGVTIDGGDHTITLNTMGKDNVSAMFSTVKGTLRNIRTAGVVGSNYDGSATTYVAALVATLNGGLVENCVNEAAVSVATKLAADKTYTYVCGLVAMYQGDGVTIRNCTNKGKITYTGSNAVMLGGVAAMGNTDADAPSIYLEGCSNVGEIVLDHPNNGNWDYLGGVVAKIGVSSKPFKIFTVKNCTSSGKISIIDCSKIRGGGLFGSCGCSTDYDVSGNEFSGEMIVTSESAVDRLLGGVAPGFSEAGAIGTISDCVFSGKIVVTSTKGNFYIGGIYGNNGSASVVIDNCRTTSKSVIECSSVNPKSIAAIAARPNAAGFTVKNCKIAGSVRSYDPVNTTYGEQMTISADNIADWMFKGSATSVSVTLENNGFNAE